MGNSIVLDQDSAAEEYASVLRGRYVTSVTVVDGNDCAPLEAIFTLDNGITLVAHGNEGCTACGSDWYYIEKAFACGSAQARIMSAHVKHNEYEFEDVYTIFVMFDGISSQVPLMAVRGSGYGYYGTGFTLTVYPTTSEKYGPHAQ
jgi:hypothetical protein